MIEDLMKLTFEAGHLMKCLTFKSIQTQIKMPTGAVIYYCICKTGYMDWIRIWWVSSHLVFLSNVIYFSLLKNDLIIFFMFPTIISPHRAKEKVKF